MQVLQLAEDNSKLALVIREFGSQMDANEQELRRREDDIRGMQVLLSKLFWLQEFSVKERVVNLTAELDYGRVREQQLIEIVKRREQKDIRLQIEEKMQIARTMTPTMSRNLEPRDFVVDSPRHRAGIIEVLL